MQRTRCVVSDHYQFVVLLIPKNASSTIRLELRKETYASLESSLDKLNDRQQKYLKIVFLRDPIARFFSAYHEVYIRHKGQIEYHKRNKIDKPLSYPFLCLEDTEQTLLEFLEHIRKKGFFDRHIRRQVDFIGTFSIDRYYSVDKVLSGINEIRKHCLLPEIPDELSKHRKRRVKPNMRNFIYHPNEVSKSLVDIVKELYSEDLILYSKYFSKIN